MKRNDGESTLQEEDNNNKVTEVNALLQETKRGETNSTLSSLVFSPEETNIKEEKYIFKTEKNSIPLSISMKTFRDQNKESLGKVCVIHDQTLYEELETARMESQYQKNLFAMVNHELRNPLHGILGIFNIILMHNISEDMNQQCKIGISTGNLMLCLVNDILDISQLESANFKLAEQPFSVNDALSDCFEVMKYRFEQKGIKLRPKVKGLIIIKNDQNRYKQIVINLLSNALKFTKNGYVKVTCWHDPKAKQLYTKVKDTGEGIKQEEQGKIFSMYCKLKQQNSANPTGEFYYFLFFYRDWARTFDLQKIM